MASLPTLNAGMTAPSYRIPLRLRAYRQVEPGAGGASGLPLCTQFIAWAIIVSSVLVVLETEPTLTAAFPLVFLAAELVFGIVFAVEYGVRFWAAAEHPRGRLHYMTRPAAIFDLLAVLSFLAPFLPVSGVLLRLLRLARILRLARLGRFSQAISNLSGALASRRYELLLSVGVALVLMIISSALLYSVEGHHQPEEFGSIPRALWWSVATLTTVGYGDVTPITPLGRLLAAITALSGVGIIAMPAGILASAMSEITRERREAESRDR